MKFYWFNKVCCVPECFNLSTEGEGCYKEYFDLPAEPQARSKWLNAILTEDNEHLKVCEDHFKEEDIFRDKNNRKKLRLNSIPSRKLPKAICSTCLGTRKELDNSAEFPLKPCHCNTTKGQPLSKNFTPGKKSRISWKLEEKRTLFKAIQNYGDVSFDNQKIKINWSSVITHCRANGCFGNEKELKTVWQNMRSTAMKVYKNDIFGSKLDRKVCKFLFGKSAGKKQLLTKATGSRKQKIEQSSGDEESLPTVGKINNFHLSNENIDSSYIENNDSKIDLKEKVENLSNSMEEESDQYYSISDVEHIFPIDIRPSSSEVISLLSSEEE